MKQCKRISIIAAVLLIAVMMLSACGGKTAKDVAGRYVAAFDLSQQMKDGELPEGMQVFMNFIIDLTEDGTFELSIDKADFKKNLHDAFTEDIVKQLLIDQGVAEDEIDSTLEFLGYASLSDFRDAMVESAFPDESLDEIIENVNVTGTFSVTGDTLIFKGDDENTTGIDTGKLGKDGSITIHINQDGQEYDLVFIKQA